jgi:hypothetical protein
MASKAGGMNLTDKTTAYQGKTFADHFFSRMARDAATIIGLLNSLTLPF